MLLVPRTPLVKPSRTVQPSQLPMLSLVQLTMHPGQTETEQQLRDLLAHHTMVYIEHHEHTPTTWERVFGIQNPRTRRHAQLEVDLRVLEHDIQALLRESPLHQQALQDIVTALVHTFGQVPRNLQVFQDR